MVENVVRQRCFSLSQRGRKKARFHRFHSGAPHCPFLHRKDGECTLDSASSPLGLFEQWNPTIGRALRLLPGLDRVRL